MATDQDFIDYLGEQAGPGERMTHKTPPRGRPKDRA